MIFAFTSMTSPGLPRVHDVSVFRIAASKGVKTGLRIVLFFYVALIVCPIQYWPFAPDWDNAWFFALNYAAKQHLIAGRDIVWTTGPLAYLTIPQDIGNNLARGLLLQTALWMLVLAIIWEVFFRSALPLRSLAFFTVFLALASRPFQYPQALGCAELLLAGALILLVQFQVRGGLIRYVTALAMLGFIPLIEFVGVMTVAGLVFGLILHRIVDRQPGAKREIALAVALPALVAGVGYWLTLGSLSALQAYFRSSLEVARGYSLAMSFVGPEIEILAAFETLLLLGIVLALFAARDHRRAVFLGLLMFFPFLVSLKHAFVRQDLHIMHFFCFAALALALVAISVSLDGPHALKAATVVLLVFIPLWQSIMRTEFLSGVAAVTGIRPLLVVWPALRFSSLRQRLDAKSHQKWPADLRVEPEIRAVVQREPVAFLSICYSNALLDDLNVVLYPVFVRHGAYTPFLDQLNAEWIRDKGPRFLIFDGQTIDRRHPWTETPAMWGEVYRWYNTRMVGTHNLLLERRSQPRFDRFELLRHSQVKLGESVPMPQSKQPIFWTLQCSLTGTGKMRALAFRVPEVTITVIEKGGRSDIFRTLPAVLGAPSLGNYLPGNLAEFAEIFQPDQQPSFSVEKLAFSGPGASAYARDCDLQILRPSQ